MSSKPAASGKPKGSPKSLSLKHLQQYRLALGLNQSQFWGRFGVTQSGGSRYESGREVPEPTQLLLALHHLGSIDDEDLRAARSYLARNARKGA